MDVSSALKSQYRAALRTLLAVVEACPEELWYKPNDGGPVYWRVAYHTLFYCHFYLHQKQEDFIPWDRHQPEANYIATVAHENHRPPKPCEPYSQADLKAYWQIIYDDVDRLVDALDLSAAQCGFPWYQMSTLEHQLVNIRHIQHHAAILSWRLRSTSGKAMGWVGKG
ncbi:MAG: DinB family protein [Planctomycetia bacterium]|nr:DinB family protein [Planctomycetia bacterium]